MIGEQPTSLQSSRKASIMIQLTSPLSQTYLCCKMLQHIIDSNVNKHMEDYCILFDCQHGSKLERSCEAQLVTLLHNQGTTLDKGIHTDMIVLDFSKAFDHLPHGDLLYKLHRYGIRGITFCWISAFFLGRTQRVIIKGCSSYSIPVLSGVP